MKKYGKTGTQIILNWGLQRGHIPIPKSSNPDRMKENIGATEGFQLTKEEVDTITKLDKGKRSCDPGVWVHGTSIFC